MTLTDSEVASLKSALRCWEWFGYVSTAIVGLGCMGEFIAEFTFFIKSEGGRHKLAKLSLIVLIFGIAGELLSAVRTSDSSGQLIASIEERASLANERAGKLESGNLVLRGDLERATAATRSKQLELEKAQQKTARVQKEAAEVQLALNRQIGSRVFGRMADPKKFEPLKKLLPRGKAKIWFKSSIDDPEPFFFASMVESELKSIGWDVSMAGASVNPIRPDIPFWTGIVSASQTTPKEFFEKDASSPTIVLVRAVGAQFWGPDPNFPLPSDTFIIVIGERPKWGPALEAMPLPK